MRGGKFHGMPVSHVQRPALPHLHHGCMFRLLCVYVGHLFTGVRRDDRLTQLHVTKAQRQSLASICAAVGVPLDPLSSTTSRRPSTPTSAVTDESKSDPTSTTFSLATKAPSSTGRRISGSVTTTTDSAIPASSATPPPTTSSPNPEPAKSGGGLSNESIIGIAVGVATFVLGIPTLYLTWKGVQRRRHRAGGVVAAGNPR